MLIGLDPFRIDNHWQRMMRGDGTRTWPYLWKVYDFKEGKLWPNDRPGLGVGVDRSKLTQIGRYDTYRAGMLMNQRPDGSFTDW
jgi:galactonate dehydratase